jgi:nucleotide-binding universal stress UspA family protein
MLRYRGRNKLRKEAERLRTRGATVQEAFLTGFPATEIVRCAIREKAGLIVVSSVGSLLPTRLLIGSVAEQTAQRSPVPVLLIRDPKSFRAWASGKRPLNVLVAHDFSATADAALGWAAELRRIGRCSITVAHLSTTQLSTGWLEVGEKPGSRRSLVEIRELLRSDLARRCRGLLGKSRFKVEVLPVRDSVAPRLVSLAKARGADLIVVGTNQKGTLRRLCLGSVSRGVLRDALVNVACVPMTGSSCR